ncbi:hypothetical protein [Dinoroseobacter sp. S76]|uniref:hypothetical protein n=1 Tax=Dinoroseobacter sp. S76 TaxID=3415124 RepID=UPI003C7C91ED
MSDKPEFTIRDGSIKATTWRNAGENGDYFTTSFSRTYRDEQSGDLRDTNAFSGADLLKVSALAQEAYQQSRALRQEERLAQKRRNEQSNGDRLSEARTGNRKRSRDNRER